jgi:ATP-dependent helicase/nuclease subunit B
VADRAARLFTIPAGVSFVDALAATLLREAGDDPLALARYTILLPTRRARRALDEAFLRRSPGGRPLLLPRTLPLGDLDADEAGLADADPGEGGDHIAAGLPPAIPGLRRQLLLTQAVQAAGRTGGAAMSVDQAARLAAELARLLDQVQTEQLSFARLRDLVPEDYAEHWQITLRFLSVLTEEWPRILAAEGCIDPAERRNQALAALAEAWRRAPPADPVIAAGSTGSIPATAALLEAVADLPSGRVALPGLDRELDAAAREAILADPAHPQHGMLLLLRRLNVSPADVSPWPASDLPSTPPLRARLVAEALRPAATTDAWRSGGMPADSVAAALAGVRRIDCPGPQEEAGVIALLLRGALDVPGKRAALVTPDRGLARRVAAELRRWDIDIDDSAGQPLDQTPPGVFLRLTAGLALEDAAPVPLLAVLKHPLALCGRSARDFRGWARRLEIAALRGPRPGPGFIGLRRALTAAQRDDLAPLLDRLSRLAEPLAQLVHGRGVRLVDLIDAHVTFAEALAAGPGASGAERLWAGDSGEAAANFIAELRQAARGFAPIAGDRYPALLGGLLAAQVVRPRYNRHPRLAIWGPLEARLQHADLLVLGGLNEGTWPVEARADQWLSRPMRRDFGLSAPERRVGLAAHDFAQAMGAAEVVLTRSLRVEGTPTVPSRWLLRLDGLLSVLGGALEDGPWLHWQSALARPSRIKPCPPPTPRPPVELRPRSLSVTDVEVWRRDPYAIYARHILNLRRLEPLDAELSAADRGNWVHAALEKFVTEHPRELPPDAVERLLAIGRRIFAAELSRPAVAAFWWPRFEQIAGWFIEQERARRGELAEIRAEVKGALTLTGPFGAFDLRAKADRVDRRRDGLLTIIDYKTGGVPQKNEIELGVAPQLPLEAAIAAAGGFSGIAPAAVGALEYWRLTGSRPAGEIKALNGEPAALAAEALAGLQGMIAAFDQPATAYHAVPDPAFAPRYSDYGHLARVKEWSVGDAGDDE